MAPAEGLPTTERPPLDELMLAMDVVDTLRHRERLIERELSADERDRQMIVRLREIYAGQGIEVSDDVLEQGVRALNEDRFTYTPPAPGFGVSLARIYVSRRRWGVPLALVVGIVAVVMLAYEVLVGGPERAAIAALPAQLEAAYGAVIEAADGANAGAAEAGTDVEADARTLLNDGELALARDDYAGARTAIAGLDGLSATLLEEYELRVVSRPGELSGVWRVPDANPAAQNYYLIVEAIDPDGDRLTLPIVNEEDGRTYRVSRWGVRVDEATFRAVASDKQDDGIIQDAVVAVKRRGTMTPDYRDGALSGAITSW
jgi:hypothetical protein